MKNRIPSCLILIILGYLLPFHSMAQATASPPPYWEADQKLRESLEKQIAEGNAGLQNSITTVKANQEKLTEKSGTYVSWGWLTSFLGLGTAAGVIAWFILLGKAKKIATQQINQRMTAHIEKTTAQIAEFEIKNESNLKETELRIQDEASTYLLDALVKVVKDNRDVFQEIIQSHEYEQEVLYERDILVIVHDDDEKMDAQRLLIEGMQLGRKKDTAVSKKEKTEKRKRGLVTIIKDSEMTYEACESHGLVLLWEILKPFEPEKILKYLQQTKESGNILKGTRRDLIAYLFYTGENSDVVRTNREVTNSANSPYTLYARIMETQKYLDVLDKQNPQTPQP